MDKRRAKRVARAWGVILQDYLIASEVWKVGSRNWTGLTKVEQNLAIKEMTFTFRQSAIVANAAVVLLRQWARKNKLKKIQFSLRDTDSGPRGIAVKGLDVDKKSKIRTIQINKYSCSPDKLDQALKNAAHAQGWAHV